MRNTTSRSRVLIWRFWVALASLLLVAGCASTLSARVTSYEKWPANTQGQLYRIVPSASQKNNLEFQTVADMLRAAIGPTGLVEAQAGHTARFDLTINYDNPASQTLVQRYEPYMDGWGFGPAFGGYYGGYGGWGGAMYFAPAYQNVLVEVFKNTLTVVIIDNQNHGAEVYRASAVNVSSSDNLVQAMPYLAQAVFDDFPGNNGQVREVSYKRTR
ncbi:DUF4136 domain-containing protein [Alcaligenaceae bacterium]|nr:DUF4136 domain-containing protein [Alcaligenaceae bacterium]